MWKQKGLGLFLLLGLVGLSCTQVESSEAPETMTSTPAVISNQALKTLQFGSVTLQIEVACTSAQQQQGLMNRRELPAEQGMLFVFEREQILSFWMKNTYIPLSIAYLDQNGVIVDIQDLQPLDETPRPAAKPAQYALEVNQGWFERHEISVGERIRLDKFCADS